MASADTTLVAAQTIKPRIVRYGAAIVDADPPLASWLSDLIVTRHKRRGRPREFVDVRRTFLPSLGRVAFIVDPLAPTSC